MYKGLYLGLPIGGPEYVEYRVGMAPVAASGVAAATLAAVECCQRFVVFHGSILVSLVRVVVVIYATTAAAATAAVWRGSSTANQRTAAATAVNDVALSATADIKSARNWRTAHVAGIAVHHSAGAVERYAANREGIGTACGMQLVFGLVPAAMWSKVGGTVEDFVTFGAAILHVDYHGTSAQNKKQTYYNDM